MAAAGDGAILRAVGVGFAYRGQTPIAIDWSASFGAGVTLLHGDTGSGKSTLLRVLAGELPASGRLCLAGADAGQDRAAYRRRVFFREPASDAFDQFTARACIAALNECDAGFDVAARQTLVDGFALAPHLDKPLYMLSTGSKRKVWLAAALASGRALILLDEPTGALDAASIRCLRAALGRRAARPDAAVIVGSSERLEGVDVRATIELPLR